MGIPKFFRFLRERYPAIEEPVDAHNKPQFDNFYVDMNGLIHQAAQKVIAETEAAKVEEPEHSRIYWETCNTVDMLVHLVRPRAVLFLAVDGVAPAAKMSQQRERRYRNAWERNAKLGQSERNNVLQPTDEQTSSRMPPTCSKTNDGPGQEDASSIPFDSNWITPGTPFLHEFGRYLEHFVQVKCSEDPVYQHLDVIVSTAQQPGEGEHKLADFIRQEKRIRLRKSKEMQEKCAGHERSPSHCMYGLDADLIMLALMSHEPKFSLLREHLHFDKGEITEWDPKWRLRSAQNHYVFVHIGLLREYLHFEFSPEHAEDRDQASPAYNLERVIDDFILLNMLIGNDFMPAVPFVDVHEGNLGEFFHLYRTYLRKALRRADAMQGDSDWDPYLTYDCGNVNWRNFRKFMSLLAVNERTRIEQKVEASDITFGVCKDLVAVSQRSGGKQGVQGRNVVRPQSFAECRALHYRTKLGLSGDFDRDGGDKSAHLEDQRDGAFQSAGLDGVCRSYCEVLLWSLKYYFRGVTECGWSYCYPHHYAPLLCDLASCSFLRGDGVRDMRFHIGSPVEPFEQLIRVLP
ncbi:unnamed protein product, partial [Amoebophrya sp. A25]|eukprot:GSA25T00023566001.1